MDMTRADWFTDPSGVDIRRGDMVKHEKYGIGAVAALCRINVAVMFHGQRIKVAPKDLTVVVKDPENG